MNQNNVMMPVQSCDNDGNNNRLVQHNSGFSGLPVQTSSCSMSGNLSGNNSNCHLNMPEAKLSEVSVKSNNQVKASEMIMLRTSTSAGLKPNATCVHNRFKVQCIDCYDLGTCLSFSSSASSLINLVFLITKVSAVEAFVSIVSAELNVSNALIRAWVGVLFALIESVRMDARYAVLNENLPKLTPLRRPPCQPKRPNLLNQPRDLPYIA
jgi:hypothetical protein